MQDEPELISLRQLIMWNSRSSGCRPYQICQRMHLASLKSGLERSSQLRLENGRRRRRRSRGGECNSQSCMWHTNTTTVPRKLILRSFLFRDGFSVVFLVDMVSWSIVCNVDRDWGMDLNLAGNKKKVHQEPYNIVHIPLFKPRGNKYPQIDYVQQILSQTVWSAQWDNSRITWF